MIRPVAEVWGGLWEHQRYLGLSEPRLGSCRVHRAGRCPRVLANSPTVASRPHPPEAVRLVYPFHRPVAYGKDTCE